MSFDGFLDDLIFLTADFVKEKGLTFSISFHPTNDYQEVIARVMVSEQRRSMPPPEDIQWNIFCHNFYFDSKGELEGEKTISVGNQREYRKTYLSYIKHMKKRGIEIINNLADLWEENPLVYPL